MNNQLWHVIVTDMSSSSKGGKEKNMLSLALPTNSPSLYTFIHFLLRPVQPVQRIVEVFIRPGTHHQNPPKLITPGSGSTPGLRKKSMEVWIILLFWCTQGYNQDNCKHKKYDQKYNTQWVNQVHHLSLPLLVRLMMTSTTYAWSALIISHLPATLQLPCTLPGK
jgi:hypothetical protein